MKEKIKLLLFVLIAIALSVLIIKELIWISAYIGCSDKIKTAWRCVNILNGASLP